MSKRNYVYKSFKIGFNSVFDPEEKELIEAIHLKVTEINRIVYNTYFFIKSYFLYLTQNNQPLPVLNEQFINTCFRLFYTVKSSRSRKSENELTTLRGFLDNHCEPVNVVEDTVHIMNFLKYEAEDMLKNYENEIKFTFVNKVRKYVDKQFEPKKKKPKTKKLNTEKKKQDPEVVKKRRSERARKKKELKQRLEAVKKDILEDRYPLKSKEEYHEFVRQTKDIIYNDRIPLKGLYYNVKAEPQEYLSAALKLRLNILPLRRSFIPTYITLDNECFQRLTKTRNKMTFEDTWEKYSRLRSLPQFKKYERKGFEFVFIKTDGYGVTVTMVEGKQRRKSKSSSHRPKVSEQKKSKTVKPNEQETEEYIDSPSFLQEKQNKNIVGIDPGKEDLIFCTDGNSTFRYSQVQRSKETRKKKFKRKVEQLQNTEVVEDYGDLLLHLTVKDIEQELSNCNSKSSDYTTFADYVKYKKQTEEECRAVYENKQFRQSRWRKHILKQKSESKMINNFKKKFGGPNKTIIAIGDWFQRPRIKYKEPTIGKGMRDIFRRNGYSVYLVDEYKTSCTCYQCEGYNKKFLRREDPRPKKEGKKRLVHGLLRCTTCNRYWNRDLNSSLNIHRLAVSSPNRPVALSRQKTNSYDTTDCDVSQVGLTSVDPSAVPTSTRATSRMG